MAFRLRPLRPPFPFLRLRVGRSKYLGREVGGPNSVGHLCPRLLHFDLRWELTPDSNVFFALYKRGKGLPPLDINIGRTKYFIYSTGLVL